MKRGRKMERIIIKNLFNRFNYNIELLGDGLTIITGPNGYGKSTILNIIKNLASGPIGYFRLIDFSFDEIEVYFADGSLAKVKNNEKSLSINGSILEKYKARKILNDLFARRYGYIYDGEYVYDRRQMKKYSINEYLEKIISFEDEETNDPYDKNYFYNILSKNVYENIMEIKKNFGEVYIIKEQRLIRQKKERDYKTAINVIEEIPSKIVEKINSASSNYSSVASKLDASYPNRLFDNKEEITKEEFNEKFKLMNLKSSKLSKYDLSAAEQLKNAQFKPEHAKALKIYFDDFDKKFSQYEAIINEFELFTEIVNKRLTHKEIKIEKNKGIIVVDAENKELKLSDLSSGEKQIIVLFYELLFETENNTLLLIDEPEISLHIVWQKMFMDDLFRIIKNKNLNVVVATHSPQIINNYWDKQIDLEKVYDKFNN